MDIHLPLPRSPQGKFQRYCPSDSCVPRRFQLADAPQEQRIAEDHTSLVRRLPKTTGTTCPYCGTDGEDQSFTAPEDIQAAKQYLEWAVAEDASDYMEDLAREFNSSVSRNSFIQLSMHVERSRRPKPYPWREDLLRDLTCDICGRPYGVYAIGLFCPDCGGRNVHVHFDREVELISKQISAAERSDLGTDKELTYRLLGNAHEDVLTALETYLKVVFRFLAAARLGSADLAEAVKDAKRGNPFQNVERSRSLFGVLGVDPFRVISEADLGFLMAHIEKRHVIGHNLGLVDEKYLVSASSGREGENVKIAGDEILRFAALARRIVVDGLERSEVEFLPPKKEPPK